jgi:hypothetical protein
LEPLSPLKVIDCAVPLKYGVFTKVSQTVAAVPKVDKFNSDAVKPFP